MPARSSSIISISIQHCHYYHHYDCCCYYLYYHYYDVFDYTITIIIST